MDIFIVFLAWQVVDFQAAAFLVPLPAGSQHVSHTPSQVTRLVLLISFLAQQDYTRVLSRVLDQVLNSGSPSRELYGISSTWWQCRHTHYSFTWHCTATSYATRPCHSCRSVKTLLRSTTGGMTPLAVAPQIWNNLPNRVASEEPLAATQIISASSTFADITFRLFYVSFTLWHYNSDYSRQNLSSQWMLHAVLKDLCYRHTNSLPQHAATFHNTVHRQRMNLAALRTT